MTGGSQEERCRQKLIGVVEWFRRQNVEIVLGWVKLLAMGIRAIMQWKLNKTIGNRRLISFLQVLLPSTVGNRRSAISQPVVS